MKSERLKPCPFCGNPNVEMIRYMGDGIRYFRDRYSVLCRYGPGCGAESGHYHSVAEAAVMWNQRRKRWKG